MRTPQPTAPVREPAVFRQLALPVPVFDWIKTVQRSVEAATGEHLSINQTVARIVREHQQHNEAREGRDHDQAQHRSPAARPF